MICTFDLKYIIFLFVRIRNDKYKHNVSYSNDTTLNLSSNSSESVQFRLTSGLHSFRWLRF